jgi:death-on-curing protein
VTDAEADYLSAQDLLDLAAITLGSYDIRDMGLLASAAARPRASAFGQDAYPELVTKAAALLHSLVRNHAFIDGNKRVGWVCMRSFLELNGQRLRFEEDAAYDLVIAVAEGRLDVPEIATELRSRPSP